LKKYWVAGGPLYDTAIFLALTELHYYWIHLSDYLDLRSHNERTRVEVLEEGSEGRREETGKRGKGVAG